MLARLFVLLAVAGAALVPATPAHAAHVIVRCESIDYQDGYCNAETHRGVRLVRQLSDSPCQLGRNWGYDRGGIWVDQGCAAVFRVRW